MGSISGWETKISHAVQCATSPKKVFFKAKNLMKISKRKKNPNEQRCVMYVSVKKKQLAIYYKCFKTPNSSSNFISKILCSH